MAGGCITLSLCSCVLVGLGRNTSLQVLGTKWPILVQFSTQMTKNVSLSMDWPSLTHNQSRSSREGNRVSTLEHRSHESAPKEFLGLLTFTWVKMSLGWLTLLPRALKAPSTSLHRTTWFIITKRMLSYNNLSLMMSRLLLLLHHITVPEIYFLIKVTLKVHYYITDNNDNNAQIEITKNLILLYFTFSLQMIPWVLAILLHVRHKIINNYDTSFMTFVAFFFNVCLLMTVCTNDNDLIITFHYPFAVYELQVAEVHK